MEDTFGEEKELVAAKGSGVEAEAAAARPAGCGGGVPGGVVSIPLSSIIFLQLWFILIQLHSLLAVGQYWTVQLPL